MAVPKTT